MRFILGENSGCGGNVTASSAEKQMQLASLINSETGGYAANLDCEWRIAADSPEKIIKVEVLSFDISNRSISYCTNVGCFPSNVTYDWFSVGRN